MRSKGLLLWTLAAAVALWAAIFVQRDRGERDWATYFAVKGMGAFVRRPFPHSPSAAWRWRAIMNLFRKCAFHRFKGRIEDVELKAQDGTPLPARLYVPDGPDNRRRSMLLWAHGGGWVVGSVQADDGLAAKLATEANMITLSVSYRLAPEHPYPAAVHDVLMALNWLRQVGSSFNGDVERIFLAGDSAGGNLCASLAAMNMDPEKTDPSNRLPIHGLALIYPVLAPRASFPSYVKHSDDGLLSTAQMEHFRQLYSQYNDSMREEYAFSPLLAPDSILSHFPPTLVVSAGLDPLLDEGLAFVRRLRALHVAVADQLFANSSHGFFGMDLLPFGTESVVSVGTFLRSIDR